MDAQTQEVRGARGVQKVKKTHEQTEPSYDLLLVEYKINKILVLTLEYEIKNILIRTLDGGTYVQIDLGASPETCPPATI